MATYSGNLVRTWSSAEESANFAPDPRHASSRGHADGTPQEYPTTDQVYAGTGSEYAGTSWPFDMAIGGGSQLGAPNRSHDGRGGRRMVHDDDQHREELTALHVEDGQRRYASHGYVLPPLQASTQVYYDDYAESPPVYATPNNTGAVSVMRGIDGNPQNNPVTGLYPRYGMRPGWMRRGPYLDDDRRLGRRKYRYQAQPLAERTHYESRDQPAVPGAGPDIVAFPLWKRAGTITGRVSRPALFREPPTVDRSLLATDQPSVTDVISGQVL